MTNCNESDGKQQGLVTANSDNNDLMSKDFPTNEYVIQGLRYWLNSKPDRAEQHFRLRLHETPVLAGYGFILCMNGVISYEIDKIEEAQKILRDLEKRCLAIDGYDKGCSIYESGETRTNWLLNVRQKIFGNILSARPSAAAQSAAKPTKQLIEEQIILADTYMSMAILTFLMHDIPGLMKGGWLLRKSWKIYQKTYLQLFDMYASSCINNDDDGQIPLPKPVNYTKKLRISNSISYFNRKSLTCDNLKQPAPKQDEPIDLNYASSGPSSLPPSKEQLKLDLKPHDICTRNAHGPLTCPLLTPDDYRLTQLRFMNQKDIERLMGAVSFGYGLFQLMSSLLPNKILKVISIFGFEGNRDIGMSCLKFARTSADMRSTLAMLVLLWYYSFGTQLFQHEDGYSAENVETITNLLNESQQQYGDSAIFLFFRGRLHRMQSNIQASIEAFQKSYKGSVQREIRLLCLYEIAWCRLIQLDFINAAKHFNELREFSVFSKAFYTYMTAICQGASGKCSSLLKYRDDIVSLLKKSENYKQTHINKFVQHRVSKFPNTESDGQNTVYWKLLCYEALYLWNALGNVGKEDLRCVVSDCSFATELNDNANISSELHQSLNEPMIGLKDLLLGAAQMTLKEWQMSAAAYHKCIRKREEDTDEAVHISAFAHYDLATVWLQINKEDPQILQDVKQLLRNAQKFQNYDFENRLSLQIQQELKKL